MIYMEDIEFIISETYNYLLFFSIWYLFSCLHTETLHFWYYCLKSSDYLNWKVNKNILKNLNDYTTWMVTPLRTKDNDPSDYVSKSLFSIFCSGNAVYLPVRYWLNNDNLNLYDIHIRILNIILSLLIIHASHYYQHRFAHLPKIYEIIHKTHHYFKTCEPGDSYYTHPGDNILGFFFAASPSIILGGNEYISSLLQYTIFDYVISVGLFYWIIAFEHCGIYANNSKLYLLPIVSWYSDIVESHEIHHQYTHCNYSTMFPLLDILHNTYQGKLFGKQYYAKKHWCIKQNWNDTKINQF